MAKKSKKKAKYLKKTKAPRQNEAEKLLSGSEAVKAETESQPGGEKSHQLKSTKKNKADKRAAKSAKHESATSEKSAAKSSKSGKKDQSPAHEASSPVTLQIPHDAPQGLIKSSVHSVKNYLWDEFFNFEVDQEKTHKIKNALTKILKIGAISLVSVVAVASIMVVGDLHSAQRVLPNTTIGGLKVGYIPFKQAQADLTVEIDKYNKTPITFDYKGQKVSFTPEELGAKYDLKGTALSLPVYNFKNDTIFRLGLSLFTKRALAIKYSLDQEKVLALLEQKYNLTALRGQNARLVLDKKTYVIQPEKSGQVIDRVTLASQLNNNLAKFGKTTIALTLQDEKPTVTAAQLEAQKDRLVALIQKPVALKYQDNKLTLKLPDHLDAVDFIQGRDASGNSQIQVALNSIKIMPYLDEKILKTIEVPTSPVKISQDKDGKILIEGKAEDGQAVTRPALLAGIAEAVNTGKDSVEIPVAVDKAPITIDENLKELGIKELLATGHSAYYGSPTNRMHNIKVGVSKYNGLLLKPGEEFSFNKYAGEVDAKNGFKLEKVIKQNKIELEMGGGLCQVSTTIYRAALLAGLPITERAPHSWKVSYYGQSMGHGLDATVYTGSRDLKFVNDTPGHMLIQAYVDGSEAYFKFYGTSDGRTIAMEGPIGGGLHYKWYRLITKADQTSVKETIISNYKPIPPPDQQIAKPAAPKVVAQTPPAQTLTPPAPQ